MNPRLPSSKKWTKFPNEFSAQIEAVFRENFASKLEDKKIIVEGRIYPEEILLRVGYNSKGELRQNNFEASTSYSTEKEDAVDRIHNCVDAIATMMADWFESSEELELPLSWLEYPVESKKIYLRYNTENTELEALADSLLGEYADSFYVEESETDDALSRAEIHEDLSKH